MFLLISQYALFIFLSWFSFKMYYHIQLNAERKFRDDARVLTWLAALEVGGLPLLIFSLLCYYILYVNETRRLRHPLRGRNFVLILVPAIVLYGVFKMLHVSYHTEAPLEIMVTTFGTIFVSQTTTILLASFLFKLPLRRVNWKWEMLKFNLMDSIYLSLYFISTSYSRVTETSLWRLALSYLVLIVGILGLYYWRTVGILQTQKVKEQVSELQKLNAQLTFANQQVLLAFASSLEKRDPYTAGHSERVAQYAMAIAKELGLSEADLELIHLGGLLHDIGKIGIPDYVLNKPDRLTDEEYDIMKQHPVMGEELLREVYAFSNVLTEEERQRMLEIVLYHHERPDGRGYPAGLRGDEIPLYARLTAVADAYDAMTSNRAYRHAMSIDRAERILREGSGTQFWAPAVDAFLRTVEYKQMAQAQQETQAQQEAQATLEVAAASEPSAE